MSTFGRLVNVLAYTCISAVLVVIAVQLMLPGSVYIIFIGMDVGLNSADSESQPTGT